MASLFKTSKPKIEPPARMPVADDPLTRERAQQKLFSMRKRAGSRESTILTDALTGSKGSLGA